MIHYILQTLAFQLLFLCIFDLFLKKETFFNYNRAYLLISALLSLALPFIKINSFKEVVPQQYIFTLPEVFIGNTKETASAMTQAAEAANTWSWSWNHLIYVGCVAALLLFLFKLCKIIVLFYKSPKHRHENISIVVLKNSNSAFSFFNFIFLGDKIAAAEKQAIIAHEQVHVIQRHSLDLLFFELLRILFWFNPLIYFYQKRISIVHEFIADAEAIKYHNKKSYYENLLAQVFDTKTVSFINPFFKESLIKKRIIMLSKNKSKQIHLLKYALLIPLITGMLIYTSCDSQLSESDINESKVATSDLTEEALLQKYVQEVMDIDAKVGGLSGPDKIAHYSEFQETEDYIQKRDKYIRNKAQRIVRCNDMIKRNFEGEDKKEQKKKFKEDVLGNITNESYQDYLEAKKKPEAIKNWENWSKSFQLRKHVADLDNITAEEQKIIDSLTSLLHTDEYYNTLIISDGFRHNKTEVKQENETSALNFDDAISFAVVENVPAYLECEGLSSNEEKKDCFSKSVNKFVATNFDSTSGKKTGLVGEQRISAFFTITATGEIANIKVRAPHPSLEREAYRVIRALPKPNPGTKDGKPVNVTFFLPINFNIEE
ncbi:M56 family metallopeptidase [Lacinutrix sp. Hel_I_90]|uniref:M56 family metallopeptidase n=1 Tax=Lacinutrix sp. Hel_I_90 TaxID=1249999 RepID=UPI0005CB3C71|nr:M56 family metallopeptidase [Lacinutrix sp. Hel_I_90]